LNAYTSSSTNMLFDLSPPGDERMARRIRITTFFMKQFFPAFLLLLCSFAIHAEGGCPPGEYPQQGPGWQTCVPIPGYESNPASNQKQVRYIDQWISFSADPDNGAFGISSNPSSRESAIRSATDGCRAKGGKTCTNLGTVLNACLAITEGDKKWWTNSGTTKVNAEAKSIQACKENDGNCELNYSMCANIVMAQ